MELFALYFNLKLYPLEFLFIFILNYMYIEERKS